MIPQPDLEIGDKVHFISADGKVAGIDWEGCPRVLFVTGRRYQDTVRGSLGWKYELGTDSDMWYVRDRIVKL